MTFINARRIIQLVCLLVIGSIGLATTQARAETPAQEPVVKSMHQFMEYVFEPNYKVLKADLAVEPTEDDKATWKRVKAASMMLAEGGNLLLMRKPKKEEQTDRWNELSVNVRDKGRELYKAARKKNYADVRTHYEAMLTQCNACHKEFVRGKHQLAP